MYPKLVMIAAGAALTAAGGVMGYFFKSYRQRKTPKAPKPKA